MAESSEQRAESEREELAAFLEREAATLAGVCLGLGANDQVSAKYQRAAELLRLRAAPEVAEPEKPTLAKQLEAVSAFVCWECRKVVIRDHAEQSVWWPDGCPDCKAHGFVLPLLLRTPSEPVSREAERRIEGWATEGGYDYEFTTRMATCPPWKSATLILRTPEPVTPEPRA